MKRIELSREWLFKRQSETEYVTIDLPHDYSVTMPRQADAAGGAGNGFFTSEPGTYIKYWKPEEEPGHVLLDVDGAYMCTEVICNEIPVIMHPYGYTPFLSDLTELIRPDQHNKLVLLTKAQQPSTRWYSGAGLYRDVCLWVGGQVRLEPWDTFVTTKCCDEQEAVIQAAYEISSDLDGEVILHAAAVDEGGREVAVGNVTVTVAKEGKTPTTLELTVPEPALWDTEHPRLYTLRTELWLGEEVADTSETTFGIRTISVDAANGLLLNGKAVKLRGGCIHHDHGVLGAAEYPAAICRKLSLLKEAGFNSVRCAHNPPSLQFLQVCDRLGMLVMDEAFDMWNKGKRDQDYHLWFRDWWERDIASMVLRDRSHPCVISYSVGNEIPESTGTSDGACWARKLAEEIRKYDTTRMVTTAVFQQNVMPADTDPEDYQQEFNRRFVEVSAKCQKEGCEWDGKTINPNWAARTEAFFEPMDIAGYNYIFPRYEHDHELYPERVIWGSETHTLHFYDSWQQVRKHNYVLGDYTWTAYDNLGEAGAGRFCWERDGVIRNLTLASYPWRSCYQGDLDLCGYRRPQSYFREAVWLGNTEPRIFTTHPEHYGEGFSGTGWHWYDVLDSWTFDEHYLGKPVKCEVYTDADEIEWYLNGRKLGSSIPQKAIAVFTIPYEKGEITAVAYKNGAECGRSSLRTVGAAAAVAVKPETASLLADNRDLCYFDISIVDAEENRVPDARQELLCLVDGGTLLGIFSGDPANEDQYGSNLCHAFEGRAVAIVKTDRPGEVTVTVGSNGLNSGRAIVKALRQDGMRRK